MNQVVYFNDEFMPFESARISPNDRGFLFSDGIYEVVRCYNGRLFRLKDHLQRLEYGLEQMRIPQVNTDKLSDIAHQLLVKNDLQIGEALIYLQVTRGVAPRSHKFPLAGTAPTVYMAASRFNHPQGEREVGVKVITVPDIRWARCDIKSIALIPNVLARQQASDNGAAEAIFVRDGVVLEGSHCNFCAVFDNSLYTAPSTNYILSGITRQVVLELCKKISIPVKTAPIFIHQLKNATEMMIVGTTVEITPVVQVDEWIVGDGQPGQLTQKLQQAFREEIFAA